MLKIRDVEIPREIVFVAAEPESNIGTFVELNEYLITSISDWENINPRSSLMEKVFYFDYRFLSSKERNALTYLFYDEIKFFTWVTWKRFDKLKAFV